MTPADTKRPPDWDDLFAVAQAQGGYFTTAARIPHAPAPEVEQGTAVVLGLYAEGADLCARGKLEAMNRNLDNEVAR